MASDTDAPANAIAENDTPPAPGTEIVPDGAKSWDSVLIAVGGPGSKIPLKGRRPIIVVQISEREKPQGEDTHRNRVETPPLRHVTYPEGADVYLRLGREADFGKNEPVVTVGVDFEQGGFEGLSDRHNILHVGPASPIYAAVDFAITKKGATKIEILYAREIDKERLKPYFDKITDRAEITFG